MGSSRPIPESSAMVVQRDTQKSRSISSSGKTNNFVYNHYGEKRHTKQRCFEIIGYPEWWDFSKKNHERT